MTVCCNTPGTVWLKAPTWWQKRISSTSSFLMFFFKGSKFHCFMYVARVAKRVQSNQLSMTIKHKKTVARSSLSSFKYTLLNQWRKNGKKTQLGSGFFFFLNFHPQKIGGNDSHFDEHIFVNWVGWNHHQVNMIFFARLMVTDANGVYRRVGQHSVVIWKCCVWHRLTDWEKSTPWKLTNKLPRIGRFHLPTIDFQGVFNGL